MRRRLSGIRIKWLAGSAAVVVLATAVGGWLQRDRLEAWHCLYRLDRAGLDERDAWVERVAGLGVACIPALVSRLGDADEAVSGNAAAALAELARRWPPDEPKRTALAERLARAFPRLSPAGQQQALTIQLRLLQDHAAGTVPESGMVKAAAGLLADGMRAPRSEVRQNALKLAEALVRQAAVGEALEPCREATRAGFRDDDPENRIQAIRLASAPGINLLEPVVLLLRDANPQVRRAAILAVGSAPEVIATDDLLHWLHDPDPKVRQLCEKALQGRGLREEQIQLGRLLTDPEAQRRLGVVDCLRRTRRVDPAVWLRRLSHDPCPAVRAAAVRASGEFELVDLTDRLEQIAQNDPNVTVRQLARFYLDRRKGEGL